MNHFLTNIAIPLLSRIIDRIPGRGWKTVIGLGLWLLVAGVRVVCDQYGCGAATLDSVEPVLTIAERIAWLVCGVGVFHKVARAKADGDPPKRIRCKRKD